MRRVDHSVWPILRRRQPPQRLRRTSTADTARPHDARSTTPKEAAWGCGATFHGHDGVRKSVAFYETLLDDLQFVVDDQVAEGDKVASRFTMSGTREGRKIELHGIVISRFQDGLIIEDFAVTDSLELIRQLGLRRLVTLIIKDWRSLIGHR